MAGPNPCSSTLSLKFGEEGLNLVLLTDDTVLYRRIAAAFERCGCLPRQLAELPASAAGLLWQLAELVERCQGGETLLIAADISGMRDNRTELLLDLERIRRAYGRVGIVILSDCDADAARLFELRVRAEDFINKRTQDVGHRLLETARGFQPEGPPQDARLSVRSGGMCSSVNLCNIFFIETVKGTHQCVVTHRKGELKVWSDLCRLRVKLDERFVLCRPSTVANICNVRHIDLRDRLLYFTDEVSCCFSKRNKGAIERAFENIPQGGAS